MLDLPEVVGVKSRSVAHPHTHLSIPEAEIKSWKKEFVGSYPASLSGRLRAPRSPPPPEPHGRTDQDRTWQSWGRPQPGTVSVGAAGLSTASPSVTCSRGHKVGFLLLCPLLCPPRCPRALLARPCDGQMPPASGAGP